MAQDVTRERISSVLAGILAPLAKALLRCGVSYSDLAVLAKRAFVDAASKECGVRGRPANISRVAVMTGISRKEVSRIRRETRTKGSERGSLGITIPALILEAWHTNKRYTDKYGVPKILPYAGSRLSFSGLVRSVARDTPPGALRRELLRAGAIRLVNKKSLLPVKRYFIPDSAGEKLIVGLELGLRRLTETIAYNSDQEKPGAMRFQRFVEGPRIPISRVDAAREALNVQLARSALAVDDYLATLREPAGASAPRAEPLASIGVGFYYHDDKPA